MNATNLNAETYRSERAYAAPEKMLRRLAGLYGGGGLIESQWFTAGEAACFLGLGGDYRHRVWMEERLRVVVDLGRVVLPGRWIGLLRPMKLMGVCLDGEWRFLWVESRSKGMASLKERRGHE